ncbi:MAG: histidinol dehydrogenase [Treponema sp.]|nr:histidinol dehydrogenase [Treponema sp.]
MKIIDSQEFTAYWKEASARPLNDEKTEAAVREIIAAVRKDGDDAVRLFASRFDRSAPEKTDVPPAAVREAYERLEAEDPSLVEALKFAADNIRRFALEQKKQFFDFEYETGEGLIAGQRVIPVERAAVYAPAGRFPLVSSVLMGVIPAAAAGSGEVLLASPPLEDGLPDRRVLAASHLAGADRVFALGGAQGIAALALGTETVPRADIIAGPGNKYVAAAKRLLYGEVGIDFIAGPTDMLVIAGEGWTGAAAEKDTAKAADIAAADMLAQAEHDPDARARALVPSRKTADLIGAALERRLLSLPSADSARASVDSGALIVVCRTGEEAVRIANTIAPEHLELQVPGSESLVPLLKNYGSLFVGSLAAEALGDYSAGINHTLPTSGSARFSGGLSVRHFLKIVTTLRCTKGSGWEKAVDAAERIAAAEGLAGHAASAGIRRGLRG